MNAISRKSPREKKIKGWASSKNQLAASPFPGGLQFRKCSLVIFLSAAESYATQSCITIPTKQKERERAESKLVVSITMSEKLV